MTLSNAIEWLGTNNNWLSAAAAVAALILFAAAMVKLVLPKKPQEVVVKNQPRVEPALQSPVPTTSTSGNKLDVEDFLKIQRELKADLLAQQNETGDVEEKNKLQARIAELEARIAEPEKSLAEAQKRIADLEAILEREGNEIGAKRLKEARDALEVGDYSIADDIFAEIEAREQLAVQRAARAAFGRGEVAEAEVRWADAADHFARAAELDPDLEHLFKAREYAWRAGRLPLALSLGEKILALTEGQETELRGTALNDHGLMLEAAGRYEEAEPLSREALEITREVLGERHPHYATYLNNLANLLRTTGRSEEAEPLFREALEITREALGNRHPTYAIRLNNLAGLLKATGRYEEAEPLYREALEIDREVLGEQHPDYAIDLNNLAGLLEAKGRYNEAKPLLRKAMVIRREALGERHPDYAQSLNNLAGLLGATGRSEEAEPLYREALGIVETALGPDHPNTQTVRENLDAFLANRP